ncbi:hypothetical protein [Streptomyces rubiginosohelvolus]|uniref:hypothetical protein n=1 Tax=Streptomyces rubiginosohelvolus TaxID=67362 RepID=UPI0036460090
MPRYLIRHPGKARDDILIEDDPLTLTFTGNWAVFTDTDGTCLAIPAEAGAHIERVDQPLEPAPTKE